MGRAIEIISGFVTNPAGTLTPWTMATGDSNAVRNFSLQTQAHLEDAWGVSQAAGALEVKSPKMHDNVQGILLGVPANDASPLLPDEMRQLLYPQDTLIISQSGDAMDTDCGSLLVAYDDLPGANARIVTWDQVKALVKNYLTVQTTHTTGGAAGDYGGAQPINSVTDLLRANTDYALLGYSVNVEVVSVGWRSPDFSNYRIGGPATAKVIETRDYFIRKAMVSGDPWIPVFNSANKGSTFVDLTSTDTGETIVVTSYLAQIS
jgi:hypothetical protein